MFSPLRNGAGKRLREPFGKAGLTVAVIALVFAMLGGAYAASNDNGKATASAKAKKGPRGPKGPAGPAGPQGAAGAKGDTGAAGSNGKDGTNGANGKNVVTTAITTAGLEGHCTGVGGTKLQVEGSATKEFVCNGKEGTFGSGNLPSGQTLTGTWAVGSGATGDPATTGDTAMALISFPIPLAQAPIIAIAPISVGGQWFEIPPTGSVAVRGGTGEEFDETCEGSAAAPTAPAGTLCIYTEEEENIGPPGFEWFAGPPRVRPNPHGAHLPYRTAGAAGPGFAFGTWAVKAP